MGFDGFIRSIQDFFADEGLVWNAFKGKTGVERFAPPDWFDFLALWFEVPER
jgi:hypothetical protein